MVDQSVANEVANSQPPLSFGQRAVGLTFNPGGNEKVNAIKQKYAEIIDLLESYRPGKNGSDPKR